MVDKLNQKVNGEGNQAAGRDIINNYFSSETSFTFYEDDITKVILAFSRVAKKDIGHNFNLDRIKASEKNEINNLSDGYFETIVETSMIYFEQIDDFLKSPMNEDYLKMYENTVFDLNQKLTIHQQKFGCFENVFEILFDHILNENKSDIHTDRKLIWIMLHYMYWKCDLGKGGEIGNDNSS